MALDFSWTDRVDNVDDVLAADVNAMAAAIIETQTKLGATSYGSLDDVATRLAGVISSAGKLSLSDGTTLTISSGAVTSTKNYHAIETEAAAASDDLDTINGGTTNGQVLIVRPINAAHNVVLKHGTGNITCKGEVDITLEYASDLAILIYDTNLTNWLAFGYNSPVEGTGTATYMADWYDANTVRSSGILTSDVMKLSVYDTDADSIVDEAAAIEGIATAGNSKYYGTNSGGTAGFHDIPNTGISVQEVDGTPNVSGVTTVKVTNGSLTDDGSGVITLDFGSSATDGAAIHDNTASEISAITEKTTLAANDMFLIEDSAAGNAKKMVKKSSMSVPGFYGDVLLRTVVASGGQASFDIDSIPSGYDVIKIFIQGKSEKSDSFIDNILISLNADTTNTNYYRQSIYALDTSATVTEAEDRFVGWIGSVQDAMYVGQAEVTIIHPSSPFHKTLIQESMLRRAAAQQYIQKGSLVWENTAAITRITLTLLSTLDFAEGSLCEIVGYKNH